MTKTGPGLLEHFNSMETLPHTDTLGIPRQYPVYFIEANITGYYPVNERWNHIKH